MKTQFVITLFLLNLGMGYSQVWMELDPGYPDPFYPQLIKTVTRDVAWVFAQPLRRQSGQSFKLDVDNGAYLRKTVNGGANWTTVSTLPMPWGYYAYVYGYTYSSVSVIDENSVYLCCYHGNGPWYGYIYWAKTTDGVLSWTSYTNPENEEWIDAIHFFEKDLGILIGWGSDANQYIFRSTDGGNTWTRAFAPSTYLKNIAAANGQVVILNTYDDTEYHYSLDQGKSWMQAQSLLDNNYHPGLCALDEDNHFYLSAFSDTTKTQSKKFELYRIDLESQTRTRITPSDNELYISGISTIPGTSSLIINTVYKTMVSHDSGTTWMTIDQSDQPKGHISFLDSETGYTVDLAALDEPLPNWLYSYSGSPLTGLLNPGKLDIRMDVFPSPALDLLNISLRLSNDEPKEVWVLIHDLQGKLMKKIEAHVYGEQTLQLDIGHLKTGPYAVTISTRKGSSTTAVVKVDK